MRTDSGGRRRRDAWAAARCGCSLLATALVALVLTQATARAAEEAAGANEPKKFGADWQSWHANTNVGCHGLKYERWSRLASDLAIPTDLLQKELLPPGDKATDYILTTMPSKDAEVWFGKAPPDLTLMARARGTNYLYQYLKTFYADPSRQTGVDNLRFPSTAMPDVLSELSGVKRAVFHDVMVKAEGGQFMHQQVFDHFESLAPGRLSDSEYDGFVRDTVNFLDYVSEPAQAERRALGVWVVLFLLVFTWLAWLVKREYWKDVH